MNEKVKRLNKLTDEFDELNGKINRLSDFINSIHFEDVVEDVKEQSLMTGQYLAMCNYRANLKARIRILRGQIQRDREIPPIQVMHEPSFDDAHHCGQDASCQVGDGNAVVNDIPYSIKSLEGMQVIKVCGPKCKDCPCGDGLREYPSGRYMSNCVKVELVGGYMLCLANIPIVTE